MSKKYKRGKNPLKSTINKLYILAGCRCQRCNKYLSEDKISHKYINNGNVAHIVASSEDGPRGNDKSFELSQDLNNLMLLCQECHKYIDDNPLEFPSETLIRMKTEQEHRVSILLDSLDKQKTFFVRFTSSIKNKNSVYISRQNAIDAIVASGMIPYDQYGLEIIVNNSNKYKSEIYWKETEKAIENNTQLIYTALEGKKDVTLSIFPLAPIPMIIKLGNLLSDKQHVNIFQKYREPDSWKWKSFELTNTFITTKTYKDRGNKVALIISISANIDQNRINIIDDYSVIYHIRAEKIGLNAIQSILDLESFWIEYTSVLDEVKNKDNSREVSLFLAIPVSVAFEIGRRHMTKTHPVMHIYDECDGFFKTIEIGGKKDE